MPGTVFKKIDAALADYPPYRDLREGRVPARDYVLILDAEEAEGERRGLNRDQFHLSGRMPIDEAVYVDRLLDHLRNKGIIASATYDKAAFATFRALVESRFDHGVYSTYIFPEEERLVYALAEITRPTSAGFFGSYYGYWGIWAMPAIAKAQGRAYLLDIDPKVNALALQNYERLGFGAMTSCVTQDAVLHLESSTTTYDFALIDAEGPEEHPNPDYRKKRIYHPIWKAALPRLRPSALVAVHNMLLTNSTSDRYFAERVEVNWQQFDKLMPFLARHVPLRCEFASSEGVGVYRL